MIILHVIDSEGFYGAENLLLNLMIAQKKQNLKSILLCIGNKNVSEKAIEMKVREVGLEVHSLRFADGLNLVGSSLIINKARKLKVDLIHSHGYKSNILLGIIPKFYRIIPVIATLHGYTSQCKLSKMGLYEVMDALCLHNIEGVIAVSDTIKARWNMRWFNIKPDVIKNGLQKLSFDPNYFKTFYYDIYKKVQNTYKMICIGRISEAKGQYLLLEVLKKISERNKVSLVLVGTGEDEIKRLKDLALELNIAEYVHFTGYVDNAYNLLPNFDVFVLPSFSEGLPITILEAMQASIPIVAMRVGSIPQVLGNGKYGELVEPGNAKALSEALNKVQTDYIEAKGKASAALKHVLFEYSIGNTAIFYLNQYKKVLSKKI